MCTSRDETSPPGPPPGPALRPLSSSTNDPPISPLPLASRVPCRPNQIFSTRRGAVSGKHMAQMPTAKQLFASRWAQEDSREIECLEPATWCLWCFPHGGTGSGKFLSRGRILKNVEVPLRRASHLNLVCGEAFDHQQLSTTNFCFALRPGSPSLALRT